MFGVPIILIKTENGKKEWESISHGLLSLAPFNINSKFSSLYRVMDVVLDPKIYFFVDKIGHNSVEKIRKPS